jgi:hypothetical protein
MVKMSFRYWAAPVKEAGRNHAYWASVLLACVAYRMDTMA